MELLTSLLEENEAAESSDSHFSDASNGPDAFNELFDGDEEGSYHESDGACEEQDSQVKEDFNTLFGDIDDLEDDKPALPNDTQSPSPTQEKSKKELEGTFCFSPQVELFYGELYFLHVHFIPKCAYTLPHAASV